MHAGKAWMSVRLLCCCCCCFRRNVWGDTPETIEVFRLASSHISLRSLCVLGDILHHEETYWIQIVLIHYMLSSRVSVFRWSHMERHRLGRKTGPGCMFFIHVKHYLAYLDRQKKESHDLRRVIAYYTWCGDCGFS